MRDLVELLARCRMWRGVMGPAEIEALFTRGDGQYLFARWGRPLVPVVFGVEDASLAVFKGAFEAVVTLAGHRWLRRTGTRANLMVFCFRDWGNCWR